MSTALDYIRKLIWDTFQFFHTFYIVFGDATIQKTPNFIGRRRK